MKELFSDDELIQRLETYCTQLKIKEVRKALSDFALIHQELKRKGATQQLLQGFGQSDIAVLLTQYLDMQKLKLKISL